LSRIEVRRVDDKTILVEISAEGLQSDDWYEAAIGGYNENETGRVELVTARFSPGQDGKLEWKHRISAADSPKTEKRAKIKIRRILVRVAHGSLNRNGIALDCTTQDVTCLWVRVPVTIDPSVTTTTTTATSTTPTTATTTTTGP
jgi:hypothetical protein